MMSLEEWRVLVVAEMGSYRWEPAVRNAAEGRGLRGSGAVDPVLIAQKVRVRVERLGPEGLDALLDALPDRGSTLRRDGSRFWAVRGAEPGSLIRALIEAALPVPDPADNGQPTAASQVSDRAYGSRIGVVEPLLLPQDRRAVPRAHEDQVIVRDAFGRDALKWRGHAVGRPHAVVREQMLAVRRNATGVVGTRLFRLLVHRVYEQTTANRINPMDVTLEGGLDALADELRTAKDRVSLALDVLQHLHIRVGGARFGGLLTYTQERGIIRIRAGEVFEPSLKLRQEANLLVPVPGPTKDPPFSSGTREHGRYLALQQHLLIRMRREWRDLHEYGGLRASSELVSKLGVLVGYDDRQVRAALDIWCEGSRGRPPFLRREDGVYTLAETWRPELDLLLEGARGSKAGWERARRRRTKTARRKDTQKRT